MLKQSISLLLIGAGFAGGMILATSCNLGRATDPSYAANAQDNGSKGTKPVAEEADEEVDDDEVPIKFADAPELVRGAILKLTTEKAIKKLTREAFENTGVFEVEYELNGVAYTADLSDKGAVMEMEKEIKIADVPEAAMSALTKSYPQGKIKEVSSVQAFYFEADIVSGGKTHEVKVYASGRLPDKQE